MCYPVLNICHIRLYFNNGCRLSSAKGTRCLRVWVMSLEILKSNKLKILFLVFFFSENV